ETLARLVPKKRIKAKFCKISHRVEFLCVCVMAKPPGKVRHYPQCVIPERLDLNGLARSRRDHLFADLSVHPGQLDTWLAGIKQSIRVDMNVVSSFAEVPRDDLAQFRIELFANEGVIAGRRRIG